MSDKPRTIELDLAVIEAAPPEGFTLEIHWGTLPCVDGSRIPCMILSMDPPKGEGATFAFRMPYLFGRSERTADLSGEIADSIKTACIKLSEP